MTLCVYRDRLESASVSVAVGSTCFPIGHPLDRQGQATSQGAGQMVQSSCKKSTCDMYQGYFQADGFLHICVIGVLEMMNALSEYAARPATTI